MSTDVDLTLALANVGIDAYDVECSSYGNLGFSVIFHDSDISVAKRITLLDEDKNGYSRFFLMSTEQTFNKIFFKLGYSSQFSDKVKKGKSHLFSRIVAEVNPLNIPRVLFPGIFAVKEERSDEASKAIRRDVILTKFRNN